MAKKDESITIQLAGHDLEITSPDKVFFAERGETKLDLVELLPGGRRPAACAAMGGRPVLLQRFPNGAGGKSFFQKRVPDGAPDWLQTAVVSTPNGTTSDALVAADLAHVVWAVNLGCLGFHVWPYRADAPRASPTSCASTSTRTPGVDLRRCARGGAAREARRCSTSSACAATRRPPATAASTSTSGSSRAGTATRCAPAAVAVARELERRAPTSSPRRGGRRSGASGSSSTSTRTRRTRPSSAPGRCGPGRARQVSTPFHWDELDESFHPDDAHHRRSCRHASPSRRRPVGRHVRPTAVARAAARAARRDMASGLMDAPWPPVYPKMPNEPPPRRALQGEEAEARELTRGFRQGPRRSPSTPRSRSARS